MIGALLAGIVRRHAPLLGIGAVVTVLFLGSFVVLGVTAFYVWALLLIVLVVAAALHDLGDGAE